MTVSNLLWLALISVLLTLVGGKLFHLLLSRNMLVFTFAVGETTEVETYRCHLQRLAWLYLTAMADLFLLGVIVLMLESA